MGEKFTLYNLNYLKTKNPLGGIMEQKMNEEIVEKDIDESGNEVIRIIRKGEKTCTDEKVVEIFEDRKILTKRVTEYVKPIVYKIKTEILDECGRVIDIIVQELEEQKLEDRRKSEVMENKVVAQSVETESMKQPEIRHYTVPYAQMRDITYEADKYFDYKDCDCDCD